MSLPEACPGCQRAVIDVRAPVRACEDAGNGTPQRCAWRSLRQQAALTSAPWPDTLAAAPVDVAPRATAGAPGASPSKPARPAATPEPSTSAASAAASTSADPAAIAQQQLADEKAARRALREQLRTAEAIAAEAQAIRAGLFDELERTRAELARARSAALATGAGAAAISAGDAAAATSPRSAGPILVDPMSLGAAMPSPATATAMDRPASSMAAQGRAAARRPALQFGMLALGAVVGIALGAGGLSWLRTAQEPPLAMRMDETPPASQSAPATADGMHGGASSLALAQAAARANDGASTGAAAEPTTPSGAESTSALASAPASIDLRARLQAALAAEGVAGAVDVAAGQRSVTVSDPSADRETRARTDVIIRSVYAGAQLPEPSIEHRWISQSHAERLAAARQHRRAGDESALAAANAHRDDDLMTLGAPAAGRRAAAAQAPASGAPVETRPVVLPVGRITATCNEKMANASLLRKSWVMWGCMRTSCCASSTAEHSEECRAYGQTYPLTCPAR